MSLLGDIQKAGGIGALKKVDRSKINDRSAAAVGGSSGSSAAAPSLPAGGGMANALAAALQKRKDKVSKSGKLFPHFPLPDTYGDFIKRLICLRVKMTRRKMMIGKEPSWLIQEKGGDICALGVNNTSVGHSRLERKTCVFLHHKSVTRSSLGLITTAAC